MYLPTFIQRGDNKILTYTKIQYLNYLNDKEIYKDKIKYFFFILSINN